jgi:hypothetical protein
VGAWAIGEAAHRPILVIYDQVEVKVRHPQLPCGLTPASLDAFGTPRRHFDSSNGRQTAFVGSKIPWYLLDTIYALLQLDLQLH